MGEVGLGATCLVGLFTDRWNKSSLLPRIGGSMTQANPPNAKLRTRQPHIQFRVWHLWLLALFVAVAIANIRDQRRGEPALIALAVAGFALYGFLGWGAWRVARRMQSRLGRMPALALYLVAMAALFIAATATYVLLEHIYLVGL